MTKQATDNALVEETRALIQEVESGDTAHAAWVAIQDRVKQLAEGRTKTETARLLGKSRDWLDNVLNWDRSRGYTPHANPNDPGKRGKNVEITAAKKVALENPKAIFTGLESDEIEAVIEAGHDVAMNRVHAKHQERQTDATVGELMDPKDPFKPDEFWADGLILRISSNARALDKLVQRAGGVILGSLPMDEALERLETAERQIAEVRAAVQEQVNDDSVAVS